MQTSPEIFCSRAVVGEQQQLCAAQKIGVGRPRVPLLRTMSVRSDAAAALGKKREREMPHIPVSPRALCAVFLSLRCAAHRIYYHSSLARSLARRRSKLSGSNPPSLMRRTMRMRAE